MSPMETTNPGLEQALFGASDAERRGVEKTVQRLSRMGHDDPSVRAVEDPSGRDSYAAEFAAALDELRHG
jgi:hypothetical protein